LNKTFHFRETRRSIQFCVPGIQIAWLKNVSKKPLTWNDHLGGRPVPLTAKYLKTGRFKNVDLYAWLAAARIAPPRRRDFKALAPGRTTMFARYGGNLRGALPPGRYELTFRYVNTNDGTTSRLKGVWTGEARAKPIEAVLKAPAGRVRVRGRKRP